MPSLPSAVPAVLPSSAAPGRARRLLALCSRHRLLAFSAAVFLVLALVALLAPALLGDPRTIDPLRRLRPPGPDHWFGTDHLGRSVFVRTVYGTRVSLAVGVCAAVITTLAGVALGLVAGFLQRWDGVLMRLMDAVMAIPGVLLAIALTSLFGSDLRTVIVAISIPEIPRMARLVRGQTLTVRAQPYIQAAITNGARLPRLLLRHVLPNVAAAILVQATYVFAAAMILEAVLSFLGAGTPPDIPSWGNMLAEGRAYLERAPWMLAFPGACLALLVLLVNVSGDAARDTLDPRLSRLMK